MKAIGRVLLGIFVIWQLVFLITSNLIGFLQDNRTRMLPEVRQSVEVMAPGWAEKQGVAWEVTETIASLDTEWSQLTGQDQKWALFAPAIARECVFPAIELRWENESQLVLSDYEPTDLNSYFRAGSYRLQRYERNLALTLAPLDGETSTKTAERWREEIRAFVTEWTHILDGYIDWRVRQAMQQWPGRTWPREVVLIMRRYHINEYSEAPPTWTGPHSEAIARWRYSAEGTRHALEWRDPVSGRYESVRQ